MSELAALREKYDEACQVLASVRASLELVGENFDRVDEERAQLRDRLRDADNDLLDVRGILSPNGYEPVTPLPLVPTVAPAVAWLVAERDRMRLDRAQVAEAITQALCSAWPIEIGSDLVFAEQVGHVAADAILGVPGENGDTWCCATCKKLAEEGL